MVLDNNKRVQEAGFSAFATLEEDAGPELAPYLNQSPSSPQFRSQPLTNTTMLVDTHQPISTPYDPISDFLNLDLFASSSSSPPLDTSFFNFGLDDDFGKTTSLPYDFLDQPFTSPATSSSPDSLPSLPSPLFAIDPRLMGTPATSQAMSEFDENENENGDLADEDDDNQDDDIPVVSKPPPKKTVIIVPPVAPATARTKNPTGFKSRKGTVHSGGIVKRSPVGNTSGISAGLAAFNRDKENSADAHTSGLDDGKLANYANLSSKEKRQLRNKISARNFRVRRKGPFSSSSKSVDPLFTHQP